MLRMMCCSNNYFRTCVCASVITIVQCCLHLICVLYAYYLHTCHTAPTTPTSIFFYLTYLYRAKCGGIVLDTDDSDDWDFIGNFTGIVQVILERAFLPEASSASSRTSTYCIAYIILDGLWTITAVALLMGVCCKIKECCTFLFYGPWLLVAFVVALLDVGLCAHFSLDLAETSSFTNWSKFVGMSNPDDFNDLDAGLIFITIFPSLLVCLLACRLVIVWMINLVLFVGVLRAAIYMHRQTYGGERKKMETSEARIKNWQLFYGAIEPNTEASSVRAQSDEMEERRRSTYRTYPGVDDVVVEERPACVNELRNQLPWTYCGKNDDLVVRMAQHDNVKNIKEEASSGTDI